MPLTRHCNGFFRSLNSPGKSPYLNSPASSVLTSITTLSNPLSDRKRQYYTQRENHGTFSNPFGRSHCLLHRRWVALRRQASNQAGNGDLANGKVTGQVHDEKPRRIRSLRRIIKRWRPTPSIHLAEALEHSGEHHALPARRLVRKSDLSYRNPSDPSHTHILVQARKRASKTRAFWDGSISLQSITAKFIVLEGRMKNRSFVVSQPAQDVGESDLHAVGSCSTGPPGEEATVDLTFPTLSTQEHSYLSKSGFTSQDVHLWALILMEPSPNRAALSLIMRSIASRGEMVRASNSIPLFVLNFLLRRNAIPAPALQHFLIYIWRCLDERSQTAKKTLDCRQNDRPSRPLDDQVIFIIFIRLVRHARKVWPQGLVNICSIVATYILQPEPLRGVSIESQLSEKQLARLGFICNRALTLLSIPCSLTPMKSAMFQQRAQFDLIRRMGEHRPPLPVTQEGYRALTRVLLTMKKTPQERDWAELKSRAWPPFKVSKTRLDDEKGPKYGTARAGRSIRYMYEYGYPRGLWDSVAETISGWHPDGSPTIQQRVTTSHPTDLRDVRAPNTPGTSPAETTAQCYLWVGMIEATRTLHEAWACFLRYEESGLPPKPMVYHTMFKKLVSDYHRLNHQRPDTLGLPSQYVLPGDAKETSPAPDSPAEAIYIPTEPPSMDSFLDQMVRKGVMPRGSMRDLLVMYAPTFDFGMRVWSLGWSHNHPLIVSTSQHKGQPEKRDTSSNIGLDTRNDMQPIASRTLTAFISLLCRFPKASVSSLQPVTAVPYSIRGWVFRNGHPCIHAILLLNHYKPVYRPAWNMILMALTRRATLPGIIRHSLYEGYATPRLVAMILAQEVVRLMKETGLELDAYGFLCLCRCAEGAAVASRKIRLDGHNTSGDTSSHSRLLRKAADEAKLQMTLCSRVLRIMFARLVGVGNRPNSPETHLQSVPPIPETLHLPNAAELHQYVRALGLFGDHEGILSLVKWMTDAKDGLRSYREGEVNGERRFRTLIISIRVFLEFPTQDDTANAHGLKIMSASDELLVLVKNAVNNVEEWGGWASDDEVARYCKSKA